MRNRGRHSSGQVKSFFWPAIGILSVLTAIPVGLAAVAELFRYSPYGDTGALDIAIRLGISAALMMGIPLIAAVWRLLRQMRREYRAWLATLTPGQRLAASVAGLAAMEAAHIAFRDHNREVSARLTASVMGEPHVTSADGS